MTKISKKPLDPEKLGHYINNLWSAFTLMNSKDDIRLLFKDLFTHTEYKMFAKRLEIARRLLAGENYQNIQKDLKVTSGTVSRVNNILNEKGEGLKKVNEKLAQLEGKYLERHKEIVKNMANPFHRKFQYQQKTVLGESLKVGAIALGKSIDRKRKQRTARKQLPT